MVTIRKPGMSPAEKAALENAAANGEANAASIEDVMNAIVELGDLFAAQDDALVELASLIEEGE